MRNTTLKLFSPPVRDSYTSKELVIVPQAIQNWNVLADQTAMFVYENKLFQVNKLLLSILTKMLHITNTELRKNQSDLNMLYRLYCYQYEALIKIEYQLVGSIAVIQKIQKYKPKMLTHALVKSKSQKKSWVQRHKFLMFVLTLGFWSFVWTFCAWLGGK